MKKELYIIMLISILTLTGCGKTQESDTTQPTTNEEANEASTDFTQADDIESGEESVTFNGITQKKSELSSHTITYLNLPENEKLLSSYYPPEFLPLEEELALTGTIIDGTADFKEPTIMVDVLDFYYDVVCFQLGDNATEDWMTKYSPGTKVNITCLDDFDDTEEPEPYMATLESIEVVEQSNWSQSRMIQDSKGPNGENSLAYLDSLQERISDAMANKELPFVSSCSVDESLLVVKVGIVEMKGEYIQKLKAYENLGSALDIFQQAFPVEE